MTKIVDIDGEINGANPEDSIRHAAIRQVMAKLGGKPLDESKAEHDDPRSSRPLALNVMAKRRHEAILISARRGDGKTTFLTELLRLIEQGRKSYYTLMAEGTKEGDAASLYSLGIVDPTLIESKQNLVVIVIEKIKAAVDREYQLDEVRKRGRYEDFKRSLRELATGLTLLDGIGDSTFYGKDWADADYVLECGLEKARSAGTFERSFHRYVSDACNFVNMDAFVLAIDDVDTSFHQGWPVLEALRKYFATPRLKLLMAGDLRLYNLLVRQQQWERVNPSFFDIEKKVSSSRSYVHQIEEMVDILQDQYLVKILPPENRITLPPLLSYAERNSIKFQAFRHGSQKAIVEREVMRRIARVLLGITVAEDGQPIRAALLRQPLRSVLQFISGAWGIIGDQRSEEDRKQAVDALGQITFASLMSLDLDEYQLDDPVSGRVFDVIIRWLTEKDLWRRVSDFHPAGEDERLDLGILRIASRLVELFRYQSYTVIDYWLRICVIRERWDRGEIVSAQNETTEVNQENLDGDDIQSLLKHVNLGAGRITDFVGRLAAWDAGKKRRQLDRRIRLSGASVPFKRLRAVDGAIFELYGVTWSDSWKRAFASVDRNKAPDATRKLLKALPAPMRGYHEKLINAGWLYPPDFERTNGFVPTFANTLSSLSRGLDSRGRSVAMVPAFGIVSGQGSENGTYSILKLIAMLGEVLEGGALAHGNADTESIALFDDLIWKLGQFGQYQSPGLAATEDQGVADDDTDEKPTVSDDMSDEDIRPLSIKIQKWARSLELNERRLIIAPITLARIWARFTTTFSNIVDGLKHTETRYLGVLMHQSIFAFLHAVGVESFLASGGRPGKKAINNPIKNGFSLLQLLDEMDKCNFKDDPNYCLFRYIFSYPLWGYFLAHSDEEISGVSVSNDIAKEIFKKYQQSVKCATDEEMDYTIKFTHRQKEVTFDGLFYLLNTIPFQGFIHSEKNNSNNRDLQNVIENFGKPTLNKNNSKDT